MIIEGKVCTIFKKYMIYIYMVFPMYFGFLDQYNGNIVESGVKHHNPPSF